MQVFFEPELWPVATPLLQLGSLLLLFWEMLSILTSGRPVENIRLCKLKEEAIITFVWWFAKMRFQFHSIRSQISKRERKKLFFCVCLPLYNKLQIVWSRTTHNGGLVKAGKQELQQEEGGEGEAGWLLWACSMCSIQQLPRLLLYPPPSTHVRAPKLSTLWNSQHRRGSPFRLWFHHRPYTAGLFGAMLLFGLCWSYQTPKKPRIT